MPTLFIAGATGYTGRALVAAARAAGHETVAHVRPDSRSGDACVPGFEVAGAIVDRTPWIADAMAATLAARAPTHVFALLGTTRVRGKAAAAAGGAAETYETVDRDLTLLLLRAAAAVGSPRFVYLSSLGAERPGGNAYLRARAEVEAALRGGALPWTIARPSFITGPDRDEERLGERVGAALADAGLGLAGLLGARRLRDRYASIDAVTLAAGLLAAALEPAGAVLDSAELRSMARIG